MSLPYAPGRMHMVVCAFDSIVHILLTKVLSLLWPGILRWLVLILILILLRCNILKSTFRNDFQQWLVYVYCVKVYLLMCNVKQLFLFHQGPLTWKTPFHIALQHRYLRDWQTPLKIRLLKTQILQFSEISNGNSKFFQGSITFLWSCKKTARTLQMSVYF